MTSTLYLISSSNAEVIEFDFNPDFKLLHEGNKKSCQEEINNYFEENFIQEDERSFIIVKDK